MKYVSWMDFTKSCDSKNHTGWNRISSTHEERSECSDDADKVRKTIRGALAESSGPDDVLEIYRSGYEDGVSDANKQRVDFIQAVKRAKERFGIE